MLHCPDQFERCNRTVLGCEYISKDIFEGKGEILSIEIKNLSKIYEENHYLSVIVTTITRYKIENEFYVQQQYLVGKSVDEGKKWKFYTGGNDDASLNFLRIRFPVLCEKEELPLSYFQKGKDLTFSPDVRF